MEYGAAEQDATLTVDDPILEQKAQSSGSFGKTFFYVMVGCRL